MGAGQDLDVSAFVMLTVLGLSLASTLDMGSSPRGSVPNAAALDALGDQAYSLASSLAEIADGEYDNKMQRILTLGVNGNCNATLDYLRHAVHPAGLYRVLLRSSTGATTVCQDAEPTGEHITAWAGYIPQADTAFVVPEYEAYDGDDMGMDVTVIPMRNGYAVQRVVPVEVEAVTAEGVAYRAAAAVRIAPRHSQVSMAVMHNGNPTNYYESKTETTFTLRLNETSGNALSSGTQLTIHLPYHWTNVAPDDETSNWRNKTSARGTDGWTIAAVLNTTLASGTLDFQFKGTRPESNDPNATAFDLAYATLDDGAKGMAHLVFRGWGSTQTQAGPFTRGLSVAVPPLPKAAGSGAWSLVFANPSKTLLDDIRLQNITIHQPHGLPLFASVTGTGWTKVDNITLRWLGPATITRETAQEFRFTVTTQDLTFGDALPAQMQVRFNGNGHVANLTSLAASAAYRARLFPNATLPGYALENQGGAAGAPLEVCSNAVIDGHAHRGCATYRRSNLGSLAGLSDKIATGAAGSSVSVDNATELRPGDWLSIHADFASLDAALAGDPLFVNARETRVTMYHPWTRTAAYLEDWTVWQRWNTTQARLDGAIELPRGMVHGTYAIVAERSLDLAGGVVGGSDQVVRKTMWVTIGPRTGGFEDLVMPPGTVIYDVGITVWLPEWG